MNKYSRIGKKKVVNLCIKTAYLKAAQNIAAIDVAFALLCYNFVSILNSLNVCNVIEWKCVDIRMHNYHETFVVVLWDCYGWIRLTLPLVIVQRHKRFVNTFHMAWVISIESYILLLLLSLLLFRLTALFYFCSFHLELWQCQETINNVCWYFLCFIIFSRWFFFLSRSISFWAQEKVFVFCCWKAKTKQKNTFFFEFSGFSD